MFFTFEDSDVSMSDWTHVFWDCVLTEDWGDYKSGDKIESIIINFKIDEILLINDDKVSRYKFKLLENSVF